MTVGNLGCFVISAFRSQNFECGLLTFLPPKYDRQSRVLSQHYMTIYFHVFPQYPEHHTVKIK